MKNLYIVKGKKAIIFIDAPPDYEYGGQIEITIDAADLELIKAFTGTWYGFRSAHNGKIYARGSKQKATPPGYTSKQPLLHRTIAQPVRGQNTVFKDGDSFNCCRKNLINLPIGASYVPPKYDPDTLPLVRGVHWREDKQRFEAKAYYEQKGYYLGLYAPEDWEAANKAVEIFRKLGPDEYFKKYHKGATEFNEEGA